MFSLSPFLDKWVVLHLSITISILRQEAEQAEANVWTRRSYMKAYSPNQLPQAAWASSDLWPVGPLLSFYRKLTLEKWAKMAKEQESCYPRWSLNEVWGLMVCVPTIRGPLSTTSWLVFPRSFKAAARLPHGLLKDVLDGQGKGGTLAGSF